MRVILAFVRAYPRKSLLVLGALVVAGIVEGLSLTALLPALSVAIDPEQARAAGVSGFVADQLRAIGIEPTITSLLAVVVLGIAATSLIGLIAQARGGLHRRAGRDRSAAAAPARRWSRRAGSTTCASRSASSRTRWRPRRAAPHRRT